MKYSDFKQKVIVHMEDVVVHMSEKPEPGLWQRKGDPKDYILGNPKSKKERAELVNKYALLSRVKQIEQIDYKSFHLHPYAHHMNSSQIMCYNFFRPMMDEFDGKIKMYKAKECLVKLIDEKIGEKLDSHVAVCNFEHVDDSKENTNFDFYFKKGDTEVFFEIKYTEKAFAKKVSRSSKNPHKQYEQVYMPMIDEAKDIFIDGTIIEEAFNMKYYQLGRNAIRATTKNKHVFFVCSKEREDLIKQFEQFTEECLTEEGKHRVRLIYWEELVKEAQSLGINVDDFNKRYLDFLK